MSKFLLFIGVFLIAVSIGISGVLGSGDRIRSSNSEESSQVRLGRLKVAGILLFSGCVSLGLRYLIIR
jgi:hypothetical protein